jgi:radical SAM superfamily enzyme YgiQ (UPF0313 family)
VPVTPLSDAAVSPPEDAGAIVLATLNASYAHASLGLRYLLANLGELRTLAILREYTVARPDGDIVADLLATVRFTSDNDGPPPILGLGVYIWNVAQTTRVVRALKAACPEIVVVLGGPEVSHETDAQEIVTLADYVITGWGDLSFAALCQELRRGRPPPTKVIAGEQPALTAIRFPYAEFSDKDLAQRVLYVEASRGCPFHCAFCLSALDKTAWAFDLDSFLAEMAVLYRRGARRFKFVDRTFNLKVDTAARILDFFLQRLTDMTGEASESLFLHFELVPDQLPLVLRERIARFPPGTLQFEVGIQSFNPMVQQLIARRQDNALTEANLRWLVAETQVHVHADLIFGLPGETLASFATGFDRLVGLGVQEIQLGLLKRLRGTPIVRLAGEFGLEFDADPPYTIRQTKAIDTATMARCARFARYWDLFANSGRFHHGLRQLLMLPPLAISPFQRFMAFSDWLWQRTGATAGFSPEVLIDQLFDYLTTVCAQGEAEVRHALLQDYLGSGARGSPAALRGHLPRRDSAASSLSKADQRQRLHQAR